MTLIDQLTDAGSLDGSELIEVEKSGVSKKTSLGALFTNTIENPNGSTRGDLLYRNASKWTRLPAGTAGQVLQTNGAGADPSWAAPVARTVALDVHDELAWACNETSGTTLANAGAQSSSDLTVTVASSTGRWSPVGHAFYSGGLAGLGGGQAVGASGYAPASCVALSVSLWVCPLSVADAGVGAVLMQRGLDSSGTSPYGTVLLYLNTDNTLHARFTVGTGPTSVDFATNAVLPCGVWSHLAATWDGQFARVYLDGVLAAVHDFGSSGNALYWGSGTWAQWSLGGHPNAADTNQRFNGLVAEARVASVVRSAAYFEEMAARGRGLWIP